MKKRDVTGTAPSQVIGKATVDPRGAAWSDAGTIVYAPAGNIGLFQMSGGAAEPLDLRDSGLPFVTARWPDFVPGSARFLFHWRDDPARMGIYLGTLGEPTSRRIIDSNFAAQYANGHLL